MTGPTYYDHNRNTLLATYNAPDLTEVHAAWAPAHLPFEPGFACYIGAGSGRDANWLASNRWEVVAVEPSTLRDRATRDSHQRVVWMNDALPDLRNLRALGRRFDLILLSAVWMHVAPNGRERAFRILSELLGPSGLLVITLRRGGDAAENAARGFHDTSADELISYANRRAIALRSGTIRRDLRRLVSINEADHLISRQSSYAWAKKPTPPKGTRWPVLFRCTPIPTPRATTGIPSCVRTAIELPAP